MSSGGGEAEESVRCGGRRGPRDRRIRTARRPQRNFQERCRTKPFAFLV